MDSGCSGNSPYYGGYTDYTIRIDESAPYCDVYYTTGPPSSIPTTQPSDFPTNQPSGLPTNQPSYTPSTVPSNIPTSHPTRVPTSQPSGIPTRQPSDVPSTLPTVEPSSNPTQFPTGETVEIVVSNATDLVFINKYDIEFEEIVFTGEYSDGDIFNPGYRMEFISNAQILLDSKEKVALFEYWQQNGSNNSLFEMYTDITWNFYDNNNNIYINISSSASSDKYQFDEGSLWINENKTYGNYSISSKLILFGNNDLNIFSSSICDEVLDNELYFSYGTSYKFTNQIKIDFTYNTETTMVKRSKSTDLSANSPPSNGSCTVFPSNSGNVLIDSFNLTCSDWDDDGSNDDISYNLVYDSSIFFNSEYDSLGWINTLLPNGEFTVSAIIVDSMSLPTCVDMNMSIGINLTQFDNYPTNNFTQWLLEVFQELINGTSVINTAPDDGSQSTNSTLRRLLTDSLFVPSLALSEQIVIRLLQSYVEEKNISTSNGVIIGTYEEILALYLTNLNTVLDDLSNEELIIHLNSLQSISSTITGNVDDEANVTYSVDVVDSIVDSLTYSVSLLLENSNSTLDTDTAELILDVLSDLIIIRGLSDESLDDATSNGQKIVDLVSDIANALLVDKLPGEFYLYTSDELIFKAAKISQDLSDECGLDGNVQLSDEILAKRSNNGTDYINCGIMMVYDDLYASPTTLSNYQNENNNMTTIWNRWQAPFFMLNVENENGDDDSDSNATDEYLSNCEPILISLNSSNTSFWDAHYPTCSYYNETLEEYRTEGCYVLYSSDDATVCACLHTTVN